MTTILLFAASIFLAGSTLGAVAIYEGSPSDERLTRGLFGTFAVVCAVASVFCLLSSLWRAVQ